MKRKILKWSALGLITLVAVFVAVYFSIAINMKHRIEKRYSFPVESLEVTSDSATLARGKHLSIIKGCQDCHGTDLGGKVMIDDPGLEHWSLQISLRVKAGYRMLTQQRTGSWPYGMV